ncbi:MAG: response regulator transcription factor, partial [Oscillospiraceae bacterium]|nr:response regulator transcription factor [Oscillospiraceae bacterium]
MKIIITDDDPFICTSLKTILQSDPEIEVVGVCTSGEEAVEQYESIKPDILLMDIQMGGISGLEAGDRI